MIAPLKFYNHKINHLNHGVILIVSMILLIVLSGVALAMISITTTATKAAKYTNSKFIAQQKADSIALSIMATLKQTSKIKDLTVCQIQGACTTSLHVWDCANPDIDYTTLLQKATAARHDEESKTWWKQNGQAYGTTNDGSANYYTIYQESVVSQSTTHYAESCNSYCCDSWWGICFEHCTTCSVSSYPVLTQRDRILKIIAYATDPQGIAAATRELYYTWTYKPP